jgi:hypothetical protein
MKFACLPEMVHGRILITSRTNPSRLDLFILDSIPPWVWLSGKINAAVKWSKTLLDGVSGEFP